MDRENVSYWSTSIFWIHDKRIDSSICLRVLFPSKMWCVVCLASTNNNITGGNGFNQDMFFLYEKCVLWMCAMDTLLLTHKMAILTSRQTSDSLKSLPLLLSTLQNLLISCPYHQPANNSQVPCISHQTRLPVTSAVPGTWCYLSRRDCAKHWPDVIRYGAHLCRLIFRADRVLWSQS